MSAQPAQDQARSPAPPGRGLSTWFVGFYLCLALVLTWFHGVTVNFGEHQADRAERHALVLARDGDAPWTYRLLVPHLAEGIRPVFETAGAGPKQALELAYLTWRFVFTASLLALFHRYLTAWLELPWVLTGTVLLAALQAPSYAYYWFQPDSTPDLVLWILAALLTISRRDAWLFPLVSLGVLNRETVLFAVFIHGAIRWGGEARSETITRCLGLVGTWLVGFLVVRHYVGPAPWAGGSSPAGYLYANLTHPDWLLYAGAFFGVLWLVPFFTWRSQPAELRRLALVLLPYLGLQLAFGRIREVRLLVPLALVLIPMAVLALRRRLEPGEPGGTS